MTPADGEPQSIELRKAAFTKGSALSQQPPTAVESFTKAVPMGREVTSNGHRPSVLEARLQEAWLSTQLKPRQSNGKPSSNPGAKRPRSPRGGQAVDLTSTLQSLWMQAQSSASGAPPPPQMETSAAESSTSPAQPPQAGALLVEEDSSRLLEEMLEEARREGGVLAPGGPGELDYTSEEFFRGLDGLQDAFQEMEQMLGGDVGADFPLAQPPGARAAGGGAALGAGVGEVEGAIREGREPRPPSWLGAVDDGGEYTQESGGTGEADVLRILRDLLAKEAESGAAPDPKRAHEGVSDVSVVDIEEMGAEEAYARIAGECKLKRRLMNSRQSSSGGAGSAVETSPFPNEGAEASVTGEEWQDEEQPIPVLVKVAKAIVVGDQERVSALLGQLNRLASEYGSAHQRLGAYFLEGLLQRVGKKERDAGGDGVSGGGQRGHMSIQQALIWAGREEEEGSSPTAAAAAAAAAADMCDFSLLENFHVLVTASPYLTFGQVASNSAILEACTGEPRIHIIDFGIAGGLQWPPLLQALAARVGGPPHVRLTGVDTRRGYCHKTGPRLKALASAWGVPFEYEFVESSLEGFEASMLRPGDSEWLAVNCALQLHKLADEFVDPSDPRSTFLRKMRGLSPAIVTILEQHTNLNSPFFLARFYEALYYYYSVFAALDAALPGDVEARRVFERRVLGQAIINLVACEGRERIERQEPLNHWQCRMSLAGFRPKPISDTVMGTVKALLKTYKEGYGLLREGPGSITLTWQDKALLATTVWAPNHEREDF